MMKDVYIHDTIKPHIRQDAPQKIRPFMGLASGILLGIEVLIGLYATGWVRGSLGDILVVILLYTIARTVSPEQPRHGLILPLGILAFSYCVEFLQLWGFCDRFGITNKFLRVLIGTGFSWNDLLCYTVGILPCIACEFLLKKREHP